MPGTILKSWISAVNERRFDDVLALYADDALLIPTFSPLTPHGPVERRQYFEALASRRNLTVTLHEESLHLIPVSNTAFILAGNYCWRFSIEEKPLNFKARFSFLIDTALPAPIRHHHSSQIPCNLS